MLTTRDIIFAALHVAAADVTLVACVWLLFKLHTSGLIFTRRLFPKQLACLALADLLFAMSSLPVQCMEHANLFDFGSAALAPLCQWSMVVFGFLRHLSLWIELHIAVSCLCQSFRSRAARGLNIGLVLVWFPGLSLTVFSAYVFPWRWDSERRACRPLHWSASADPLMLGDAMLCMSVCACSYCVVYGRSWLRRSPESVVTRASLKAEVFIMNALLTYSPIMLCYMDRRLFNSSYIILVVGLLECLGGFFNTLTYAYQSRYASALSGEANTIRADRALGGDLSYCVSFSRGVEALSITGAESDSEGAPSGP